MEGATIGQDHHAAELATFIHDVSQHLQTVSVFAPILGAYSSLDDLVFRHPDLDFAASHFHDAATISRPQNALNLALHTAELVRQAIA